MANTKQIIQSLQTLADHFVLQNVQIDEIPEKNGNPMYWHYYEVKDGKPTGYGFSSPNFNDFVSDVIRELEYSIQFELEKKQSLRKEYVENMG